MYTDPPPICSGSPPHTRGKEAALATQLQQCWDHPRTRGEKEAGKNPSAGRIGSPPHTRGKDEIAKDFNVNSGITPAHAGKSGRGVLAPTLDQDHPRTRGEKARFCLPSACILGSPPHTRGKARAVALTFPRSRITPAHAGKRSREEALATPCEDHPRTRGEKLLQEQCLTTEPGSPPHTRGKGTHTP